jgi:nicotinamide-nucleotide amidase
MNAARLVALYRQKGLAMATAESCTGGLVAAAITAVPGASAVFTHGFITYAYAAKTQMLDVPEELLQTAGAVSEPVALRMAQGARSRAGADVAIAITGIAGPDGGTPTKPVGTVWFGLDGPSGASTYHRIFHGNRDAIRAQSVAFALKLLEQEGETA